MREEKAAESHRKVKVKPASDESDWVEGGHSAAVVTNCRGSLQKMLTV